MKKSAKKILFTIPVILASLAFSSCHDDIYGMINKEVALENCGINGDVMSYVRFGDYIYLSNGKIYYKTNRPSREYYAETGDYNRQWHSANLPVKKSIDEYVQGATTNFLASDSTYLYALTYSWVENSSGVNTINASWIFYTDDTDPTDGIEWKGPIDLSSITGETYNTSTENTAGYTGMIFDNKAWERDTNGYVTNCLNTRAYARLYDKTNSSYAIYRLDGGNVPAVPTGNVYDVAAESSDLGSTAINCIYFSKTDTDYFSNYYAMDANDDYYYYVKSVTSSNNVSGDSKIYYSDGTDTESVSCDAGSILSIAVTTNYILLGTTSGLHHTALTDGIPSASISGFSGNNNAESIISEYVFKVFALEPDKKDDVASENGTDEYAASTIYGSISGSADSFRKTGNYSYYPGRGTWNRDGTSDTATGGN